MRKSDEFHAGDVDVYQDMSSATVGPRGKMCKMQLTTQVLLISTFLKHWPLLCKSVNRSICVHFMLANMYVYIADGKVKGDTDPAPAAPAPVAPPRRVRLTMNHLVFHKVLGKGSFGKVGQHSHVL